MVLTEKMSRLLTETEPFLFINRKIDVSLLEKTIIIAYVHTGTEGPQL